MNQINVVLTVLQSWGGVSWLSDSNTTMWSPLGSSSGSPEGPSQEPSPPVTPGKDQAWENKSPTYAAVLCKLDKLGMKEQGSPTSTTPVAENPKQGVTFDQSQDSKVGIINPMVLENFYCSYTNHST